MTSIFSYSGVTCSTSAVLAITIGELNAAITAKAIGVWDNPIDFFVNIGPQIVILRSGKSSE
ncbi:hypothetical protein GCM10009410_16060 [Shewanella ulleungensis]|uniref:Uncharacterized protein n=1 Tax=Shewanella ulleungensis TaxID=2282699 RepID=A0ABQ2QL57_9GAMM|nr:hypothetical protein GCM10009410_16060 [Shewanella ulleungensis]